MMTGCRENDKESDMSLRERKFWNRTKGALLQVNRRKAQQVYIDVPGWQQDIRNVRKYSQLPVTAQKYVETIEKLVGKPVKYVSIGPHREAMILR